MKSTSCLSIAALSMALAMGVFTEAKAQMPDDYIYWPFFYHAKPAPQRTAIRPLPAPQRRTVAYNNIQPPVPYRPALIFGVGY